MTNPTPTPRTPQDDRTQELPSDRLHVSGGGLPVALPLGSGSLSPYPPARRLFSESRGTNASAPRAPKPSTPRVTGVVGARQLDAIREGLSDRDLAVLTRIAEHRYLTTLHLQSFCFMGHGSEDAAATTTRRVLRRLEQHGLIRRLSRRVGGVRAGSGASVWQLAPAGARLLRGEADGYRVHEPCPRFLGHCLAVADAHLALRALASDTTGTTTNDVLSVAVQVEPLSWRTYLGTGGERRTLKPDLAAEITTSEYVDRWFIEVDCGTESISTLVKKCHAYQHYRASGEEQTRHGAFPRVLWVMGGSHGHERAERLRSTIRRSHDLTPELYELCSPDEIAEAVLGGDSADSGGRI